MTRHEIAIPDHVVRRVIARCGTPHPFATLATAWPPSHQDTRMTEDHQAALEAALKRAGITPPPGRMRGLLVTHRDLQAMLPMLRNGRSAAAEPAGIYALETITRGDKA